MTAIELVHRTTYAYERPLQLGPQRLRLRPLPDPRRPAPAFTLALDPAPLTLHWLTDPWGNQVARFALPHPVDRLAITTTLGLDLTPRNPFDFILDAECVQWPIRYARDGEALDPFLRPIEPNAIWERFQWIPGKPGPIDILLALAAYVRDRVAYVVRDEPGVWSPPYTLDQARGSCRDSAWLLVALLRLHGIAARFVSGYLVQLRSEGPPPIPRDTAELHAWAEAYLPGAGWVGIDATSGLLAAEGHVAVAASPDPAGAGPLDGTLEPGNARLESAITVSRPQ